MSQKKLFYKYFKRVKNLVHCSTRTNNYIKSFKLLNVIPLNNFEFYIPSLWAIILLMIYISNLQYSYSVRMTGFRLSPWKSYRHQTCIIRTWRGTERTNFLKKWPVVELTKANVRPPVLFYGKNFSACLKRYSYKSIVFCRSLNESISLYFF
jgi:hypothetical protein